MIKVICGDITKLGVDAIVNAANSALLPGGGVDGAIRRAAGHEMDDALARLGGCPVGEARLTLGFHLPARYVIHTVGPIWQGGNHGEPDLLHNCYRSCFKLAMDHDMRTIAFPCISTGVYGYPSRDAAIIAVEQMQFFENHFAQIIACCFSPDDEKLYLELLAQD